MSPRHGVGVDEDEPEQEREDDAKSARAFEMHEEGKTRWGEAPDLTSGLPASALRSSVIADEFNPYE